MNIIKKAKTAVKVELEIRRNIKRLETAARQGKRIHTLADGSYMIIVNSWEIKRLDSTRNLAFRKNYTCCYERNLTGLMLGR